MGRFRALLSLSLSCKSWSPHPEECAWSDYCNNFEEWESIFLQSNKFTASKVRDLKEVAKSLMTYNLSKIIHPFQNKKYLKTSWNLNCNPHKFLFIYFIIIFLIGFHSMQGWTATERHGVTRKRKRSIKRFLVLPGKKLLA